MNTTEYDGWTNYETWAVALWINNDDDGGAAKWQGRVDELRQTCYATQYETVANVITRTLADDLENAHSEHVGSLGLYGFAADLLNAAVSEVNWREIASVLLDE